MFNRVVIDWRFYPIRGLFRMFRAYYNYWPFCPQDYAVFFVFYSNISLFLESWREMYLEPQESKAPGDWKSSHGHCSACGSMSSLAYIRPRDPRVLASTLACVQAGQPFRDMLSSQPAARSCVSEDLLAVCFLCWSCKQVRDIGDTGSKPIFLCSNSFREGRLLFWRRRMPVFYGGYNIGFIVVDTVWFLPVDFSFMFSELPLRFNKYHVISVAILMQVSRQLTACICTLIEFSTIAFRFEGSQELVSFQCIEKRKMAKASAENEKKQLRRECTKEGQGYSVLPESWKELDKKGIFLSHRGSTFSQVLIWNKSIRWCSWGFHKSKMSVIMIDPSRDQGVIFENSQGSQSQKKSVLMLASLE